MQTTPSHGWLSRLAAILVAIKTSTSLPKIRISAAQEWHFAVDNFKATQIKDAHSDNHSFSSNVTVSFVWSLGGLLGSQVQASNLLIANNSTPCNTTFSLKFDGATYSGYPFRDAGQAAVCNDPDYLWYYSSFHSLCDFAINIDNLYFAPSTRRRPFLFEGKGTEVDLTTNSRAIDTIRGSWRLVTLNDTLDIPITAAVG